MSSYMSTPAFADERIPPYGNFDGLNLPSLDRTMIQSGFEAVESVEGGWDFLRTYEPPADQGFMFSMPPPKQKEIDEAISNRYDGHSGASYGWTMRVLQKIAKLGWDSYARTMLNQYGPPPKPVKNIFQKIATVDTFISSLPANASLTQFADAIQKDPGMRAQMPDIDAQADALKRFAEGKMSYAEMRTLCG